MGFDLTVVFTGLVGFVENTCRNSRAQMCALLVDGDRTQQPSISTLDGSTLRTHRAFVKFPISNVSVVSRQIHRRPMDQSFGLWYLRRDRIFFEIENDPNAPPGVNDFHIERMEISGQGHPTKPADVSSEDHNSFTWALDMQKIFPCFEVDPLLLSQTPPLETLAAQVVIDRGKVRTKSFTRAVWDIDSILSGKPYRQVFSHEIMVSYTKLAAARMVAVDFDNRQPRKVLDLTSLERCGSLEVHIINVCSSNPLQWPTNEDPKDDEDSKWNFELASTESREEIRRRLKGGCLPIPRPFEILRDGPGAPGSGNCIPPRLSSAPFSFKEFDGSGFKCEET
jgi:hypothetical protein